MFIHEYIQQHLQNTIKAMLIYRFPAVEFISHRHHFSSKNLYAQPNFEAKIIHVAMHQ